jgi:hypothetical protein
VIVHFNPFLNVRVPRGTSTVLPIVQFEQVESIYDGARWMFVLESANWTFWESLFEGESSELRSFQYQFGLNVVTSDGSGEKISSDWYPAEVVKAEARLFRHGANVKVIGSDLSVRLKRRVRTTSWRGPFHAIVAKIAQDHGMQFDVDPADESLKNGVINRWQYGENDWDYLQRESRKQVSRLSGRSDYCVWPIRGNRLVVRPPGVPNRPKKIFTFGDALSSADSIRFVQRKKALQLNGGFSAQAIGFDMLSKTPMTFTRNYRNFPQKPFHAPRLSYPENYEDPALTFSTPAKDMSTLQRDASLVIGSKSRQMYLLEIGIFPDFEDYDVGDIFTLVLDNEDQNGESLVNSVNGNYLLEQRRVRIQNGSMSVKLLASRIGSQIGDATLSGVNLSHRAAIRRPGRDRSVSRMGE